MADVITCPSGLQGRVRGMKVLRESTVRGRRGMTLRPRRAAPLSRRVAVGASENRV